MTFGPKPGSRCPVVECLWRPTKPMWEPGGTVEVDDHMVDRHPTTEWAKRVVMRRSIDTVARQQ